MTKYEEALKIMDERFGHDCLISVATIDGKRPAVRIVNSYYEDGSFYTVDDDFYAHAEIVINEQTILGISEKSCYDTEFTNGNNMQFWVTFEDEQSIIATYEVLKEQGVDHYPLAPCKWCKSLADITDKYGVRWMLNVF